MLGSFIKMIISLILNLFIISISGEYQETINNNNLLNIENTSETKKMEIDGVNKVYPCDQCKHAATTQGNLNIHK